MGYSETNKVDILSSRDLWPRGKGNYIKRSSQSHVPRLRGRENYWVLTMQRKDKKIGCARAKKVSLEEIARVLKED